MKQLKHLTIAFLCLSGCSSMAPHYTQPPPPIPAAWPSGPAYQEKGTPGSEPAVSALPWQDFFADPRLRALIALALENNRDLRVAALNIERSRAQYRIQRADLSPKINGSATGSAQRIPADLSSSGSAMTAENYIVGFGLSAYELDFFGRIQSLSDQALAQYFATQEARRTVQISLIAEVATNYLNLAADRERLNLAEDTLTAQSASYNLIQRRFELGISSELDQRLAQTRVEAARVDIARYTTLVAQDENGLKLVTGSSLPAELLPQTLAENLTAVKEIAPNLPSETLLQRPDILQAEQQLKGFNANIGAARAAFFPRIALSSSVGLASADLFNLFRAGAFAWSLGPQMSAPIFDQGSNQAALEVAETDKKIAVARYEKAIQTAFREVSDGLAQQGTINEQAAAQQALTEATAATYRLSQARFDKGIDSYLNVLDAQRSLYTAQQGMIATRLTRLTNLVTLYKVLGGGGIIATGRQITASTDRD